MKNAEFKKYYNEMKDCFTDCPIKTIKECKAMETLYRTKELLTDKQDAAIAAYFAEIELNLHDAIIAKNAAVEMAKASANGGWKKGRKTAPKQEADNKHIDSFVESMFNLDAESVLFSDDEFAELRKTVSEAAGNCKEPADCDALSDFYHVVMDEAPAFNDDMRNAVQTIINSRKDQLQKGGKKMPKNVKKNPAGEQPAQTPETPAAQPAEQPTAPVEVLNGEVINTKDEAEINAAIDRISSKVVSIGRGYLDIVGDVARLRNLKAWKITGHKSLYDLCADKFGMSRATVGNLEAVFKKYGNPDTYTLKDECANMSLREMLSNIAEEKKALKGETAGEPVDGEAGDGDGAGEAPAKKGKAQTLINVTWELAGDDWDIDAILDNIRKQLEANPDAKEAFPDGANVAFTITI